MNINIIIDYLIISAVVSLVTNLIARNIAKSKNILVDLPDRSRKFHKRPTPLTGGIGILLGLLLSGKIYLDLNGLNGFMPIFTRKYFTSNWKRKSTTHSTFKQDSKEILKILHQIY